MSAVRLSVCVPVYNFAAWFGATVESIARQAPDGVEILVVDGASTDDTPAVAAALTARYPRVRYHRLERRGGIDGDIARSVELARGDYCWVFGGDDLMRDADASARNWAAYLACRFTPAATLPPLKRLLDLYRAARAR